MRTVVTLDPRNKVPFASFYLEGLRMMFGEKSLNYSVSSFVDLNRAKDYSYDHYMCFIVARGDMKRKIIIDFHDSTSISAEAYRWCDVYAKINIATTTDMSSWPKLISIPPGFGIRTKSVAGTLIGGIKDLLRMKFRPINGLYAQFYNTYAMLLRPTIQEYEQKSESMAGYVFHASTLWSVDNCMQFTNPYRATFIRTCKSLPEIRFEGGLIKTHGDIPQEYEDVASNKRYKFHEYFQNTMRSMFVFNTPAVHQCHGWKLGEYLAMGKAIISTPISNRLPFPFEDGKNLLVVHNQEELVEAIHRLSTDNELRRSLEESSRNIYTNYCSPIAVMRSVLGDFL